MSLFILCIENLFRSLIKWLTSKIIWITVNLIYFLTSWMLLLLLFSSHVFLNCSIFIIISLLIIFKYMVCIQWLLNFHNPLVLLTWWLYWLSLIMDLFNYHLTIVISEWGCTYTCSYVHKYLMFLSWAYLLIIILQICEVF